MKINRIYPLAGMLVGLALAADAVGQDRANPDQLRSRDQKKDGKDDPSAQEREFAQRLRQQQLRLRQLREQGKEEQAEALRRQVERLIVDRRGGKRPGQPGRERENDRERPRGERARHLAAAIEHLHAAGLHELANNLARELEGEQDGPRRVERERERSEPGVGQLREEVAHLRELLHKLIREREQDKPREKEKPRERKR